jgi:tRNA(Ile)-lysidine synthase
MASSRKSASQAVAAAIAALGRGAAPADPMRAPLAVAFSGGLDSTVLLDACVAVAGPDRVIALHVHHGLQAAADAWPAACEARARAHGCGFRLLRAIGAPRRGDSIEAWAREERYRLLLGAAQALGAAALLTAHHADDQLETVLLALARGSGLDGLTGIAGRDVRDGVTLLRPLLGLSRDALATEARERGLQWIDDPSNASMRHLRNAVRERVVPVLVEVLPGIVRRVPEAVALLAQAREALDSLAADDLASATVVAGPLHELDRIRLAALPAARRAGLLRCWIVRMGERPPSRAKLDAIQNQLVDGAGAGAEIRHGRLALMRYRHRIVGWVRPAGDAVLPDACAAGAAGGGPTAIEVRWEGESRIELPGFGGTLHVMHAGEAGARGDEDAGPMIDPSWLRGRALQVEPGRGGARLRPHPQGPSRTLKNLHQELGVPSSLRAWFPVVRADRRLLYAAPFGMDRSDDWPRAADGVRFCWEPAVPADPRRLFGPAPKV